MQILHALSDFHAGSGCFAYVFATCGLCGTKKAAAVFPQAAEASVSEGKNGPKSHKSGFCG